MQLKFSAVKNAGKNSGLTIPAEGVGGSWIAKLPSERFAGLPENEFSMITLASLMGMDVPEVRLLDLDAIDGLPEGIGKFNGPALAVRRFDRTEEGPVHIEDFSQVFGIWPDMHVKNWSLIYPDRRRPGLRPAYDFVSTIPYIPDEYAAIKYARTKRMSELSLDELDYLAAKARLPEKLVRDAAVETIARFRDLWVTEKTHLPLVKSVIDAIETHMDRLALLQSNA